MSILKNIDTVIFDIGNVIIDIDYEVMIASFKKIAHTDIHTLISYHQQNQFFDLFEKGKISVPEFRQGLRKFLKDDVTDAEIDHAWDSILIHYPPAKFQLLQELKKDFRVLALSNINEIHVSAIDRAVKKHFGATDMRSYFHHVYYSHEVGHRKPEKEIYELVLDEEKLDPARTLFIDDKAENTEAAAGLGIQVYHLSDRDSLLSILAHEPAPKSPKGA
jgi:epoxide hydrolase-like predicted phosphatase